MLFAIVLITCNEPSAIRFRTEHRDEPPGCARVWDDPQFN